MSGYTLMPGDGVVKTVIAQKSLFLTTKVGAPNIPSLRDTSVAVE